MLTDLLRAIEEANGAVTGVELSARLGISPGEVAAMLDALRAADRLGTQPEQPYERADGCTAAGVCSMSCPGPADCPLTVDLSVAGLEIKRPSALSHSSGPMHA